MNEPQRTGQGEASLLGTVAEEAQRVEDAVERAFSDATGGGPGGGKAGKAPLTEQIGQRDLESGTAWAFEFAATKEVMSASVTLAGQPPVSLPLTKAEVTALIKWLSAGMAKMTDEEKE